MNRMDSVARQILEREREDSEAIALLLERYLSRSDRILVQKTQMGSTEAFIGSVTLEWLANRVGFASQLPLFREKLDPNTNNLVRDPETVEKMQQRPLDWSRQAVLAQYLATRKFHKFPAVLVVINPSWVDEPKAKEWDKNGRATTVAADFTPLDSDETMGLLDISEGVSIFTLDGQHRLMGIQGLMELQKTGTLPRYTSKDKKSVGTPITMKELTEQFNIESSDLSGLAAEKIGIEFIPAVAVGETREEARRRIRSIFVHVNLMAVSLTKGQLALLNEDNGFAIVARQLALTHSLFANKEGREPRVHWDSATVAAKSTVLTTLQALQDMCTRYLEFQFPHWKPRDKGLIPMRPEDEELEEGIADFQELLDHLATLPSYQKMEKPTPTYKLRRFSHEKPEGEGNMLFRPVGQIALVQALAILVFRKGLLLADIFDQLRSYDLGGGFAGIDHPQSLWYGVLFDPNKKRIFVSRRDLATKLIVYLIAGVKDKMELAYLREELARARTFEDKAVAFDGNFVAPKDVGLPDIL